MINRQENEYFLNFNQYLHIKKDLEKLMTRDENSYHNLPYKVRSIYFDDIYFKCIDEKLSGERHRSKYRFRV